MGTIKATNIEPIADNGTVTLGGSGDIFTLGSGTKASFLYPAFEAHSDSNQSLSDNTYAKVNLQTEILDTDNNFDNSSNYRFTPTTAGKYYIEGQTRGIGSSNDTLRNMYAAIYKNGSLHQFTAVSPSSSNLDLQFSNIQTNDIVHMNGSTDYVEFFGYANTEDGGNATFDADGNTGTDATWWGGFLISGT